MGAEMQDRVTVDSHINDTEVDRDAAQNLVRYLSIILHISLT
jgi:hypothetical protein